VLTGDGSGFGVHSIGAQDVQIIGCTIQEYARGIHLDTVEGVTVTQSVLTNNSEWGLHIVGGSGFRASQLYISENDNGLLINAIDGANLEQIHACHNLGTDIAAWDSSDLTGVNNACTITEGWADTGADVCTFTCSGPVTIMRSIYLPMVMRSGD
jgi:hypothetical protein